MDDIEQQSAGSIRHVSGTFAGEAKTDVVLRKHHRANTFPVFRFVLADPEQFRKREIRQCGIAGELHQTLLTDFGGQIAALLFSANVAPDQSGANDATLLIEHNRAVHLTGEANASDFFGFEAGTRDDLANRDARGAPPVFGMLLGPADLRRSKGLMLFRGGSDDPALAIDNHGPRSSVATLNPDSVNRTSSTSDVAHPRYWKRSLSHFVGHEEERAHFEAGIFRSEAVGVVLLLDVDDLLGGGNSFERDVVVVAVLEYDETAADTLQQEIEGEITVSHRSDRVNGVGVAAANEITELLIDDVDFLAIIKFSGNFPDFFAANFPDASDLFLPLPLAAF